MGSYEWNPRTLMKNKELDTDNKFSNLEDNCVERDVVNTQVSNPSEKQDQGNNGYNKGKQKVEAIMQKGQTEHTGETSSRGNQHDAHSTIKNSISHEDTTKETDKIDILLRVIINNHLRR